MIKGHKSQQKCLRTTSIEIMRVNRPCWSWQEYALMQIIRFPKLKQGAKFLTTHRQTTGRHDNSPTANIHRQPTHRHDY